MNENTKQAYEYGRWEAVVEDMQEINGGQKFNLPRLQQRMMNNPRFMYDAIMKRTRFDERHKRMLEDIDLSEMPEMFTRTEWGSEGLGFWQQRGKIRGFHD